MIKINQSAIMLLFALVVLVPNSLTAQLYVGQNTYIYNSNEFVYVTQDVNLSTPTSFFYLRKEGQLLQGTTGAGANSGLGSLSVFQEGTVNQFAYNYWCSPVGGNNATLGNSPFSITQFGVPINTTTTQSAVMTGGYDGASSFQSLSIAKYWIYKFLVSEIYAEWLQVYPDPLPDPDPYPNDRFIINTGEGFTMKGVEGTDSQVVDGVTNNPGSNQRYDFRGKPNDGIINIPSEAGTYTLTGNPYPSAIDLSAFLLDPTNNTAGIAYFWDQNNNVHSHNIGEYVGGYGTFVPCRLERTGVYIPAPFLMYNTDGSVNELEDQKGAGADYERRFCPVGQGFMVDCTGSTIQMKNQYRVFNKEGKSNFSEFAKHSQVKSKLSSTTNYLPAIPSVSGFDYTTVSKLPVPQIRLNATIESGFLLTLVLAFDPSATDAMDIGMDAVTYNEDFSNEDVYFINDTIKCVMNTTSFDINKRFPLGLKNTSEATFKINVNSVLSLAAVENVYIHDKENDTYHDIKNGVYTVTMSAGVNTSRFEVTFINDNVSQRRSKNTAVISNEMAQNLTIIQNNRTQNFTIENPKSVDLKECKVFDVSGKLIWSQSKLGSAIQYDFGTSGWSNGVYIVKLTAADNQVIDHKIIVSKTN